VVETGGRRGSALTSLLLRPPVRFQLSVGVDPTRIMGPQNMRRRLLGSALVLPLLAPFPQLVRAAMGGSHECRDHICMCARRCPPKRNLGEHCQGPAKEPRQMRGACNHDPVSAPGAGKVAVVPSASLPAVLPVLGMEPPLLRRALPSGHTRVDPPPPRAR
jgi:hypothetical protein